MGVVYDPERVAENRVPQSADGEVQRDAAIVLGEALHDLTKEPRPHGGEIITYMLYGSASEPWVRTVNRRSDVDLLVVVDTLTDTSLTWGNIAERVAAVQDKYLVDVNTAAYRLDILRSPVRVNPFYARHLISRRGLITNDCLQYTKRVLALEEDDDNPLEALEKLYYDPSFAEAWPFANRYIEVRRGHFQTALDQTEPDLTALKGPFEFPRNLGRSLKDLFDMYVEDHTDYYDEETDDTREPIDFTASAAENLQLILGYTNTGGGLSDDLLRLTDLDVDYTNLLEATVAGDVSVANYEKWLKDRYVEAFERAFRIAEGAGCIVEAIVELAKIDPTYGEIRQLERDEMWYPESPEWSQELYENAKKANQIVPGAFDMDDFLFKVAPRHPEVTRRYVEHMARRRRIYDVKDRNLLRELQVPRARRPGGW